MVGIADNSKVVGTLINDESIQKFINLVKQTTTPSVIPDVFEYTINGKKVLQVRIAESPIKPIGFKGRFYKRHKNSNHLLTPNDISNLHLQNHNTSWDYAINQRFSLNDISFDIVRSFITACNSFRITPITDEPATVLEKFDLLDGNSITNGCYLLFGRADIFTNTIELGRFDSDTIVRDSLTLRSNIFSEIESVLDFILKHIEKSYIIDSAGKRKEHWSYPTDAIRELVVNMILHRDYRLSSDSIVKIFNNRIELINPGGLVEGLQLSEILTGAKGSKLRNKQIAYILKEAGWVEKYGSGIRRAIEAVQKHGSKPLAFSVDKFSFKVTMFAHMKDTPQGIPQDTPQVAPQVESIIKVLTGEMTREELQANLSIKDRKHFSASYLRPAIDEGLVELTIPDKPNSRYQKYKLSLKGKEFKKRMVE